MHPRLAAAVMGAALSVAAAVVGPAQGAGTADVAPTAGAAGADRPNVVLVIMDDLRRDDMGWLPRVQRRITDAGTSYRSFYAPTSLCCPARASIMRGQYPHNTGILTNAEPDGGFAGSRRIDGSTLATWLDPTYTTGMVGKYLNGYRTQSYAYIPPGWDFWVGAVVAFGYLSMQVSVNGRLEDRSGTNSPDVIARSAQGFIDAEAGGAEPFFLQMSIVNPHNGRPHNDGDGGVATPYVPRRDRGSYTGPPHAQNPSYDERDVTDKTGPSAALPRLSAQERADVVLKTRQRRESLASADRAIGRVLRTLRATGEMPNTYVIFTSDNGYLLGEHRIFEGKRSPYQPASQLPLSIAGPGVPAGHEWTTAAGSQDLAPTILEMTGARADFALDGRSILPSAQRLDGDPRRGVLLEGARRPVDAENDGRTRFAKNVSVAETDWSYRAIVTRRWKLIHWVQTDSFELYNLQRDPYEVRSVWKHPRYLEQGRTLRGRLADLRMCQAATCDS